MPDPADRLRVWPRPSDEEAAAIAAALSAVMGQEPACASPANQPEDVWRLSQDVRLARDPWARAGAAGARWRLAGRDGD